MSFLSERLFQLLDSHNIYQNLNNQQSIRHFMERHFICAWGHNALMFSLLENLTLRFKPVHCDRYKEAMRLILEIALAEAVEEQLDGKISSHLEMYIEAMENMQCNMDPVFEFLDNIESGMQVMNAADRSSFPSEVKAYVRYLSSALSGSLHERATALFYEGEPFVPDSFLIQLSRKKDHDLGSPNLLDYFERHIEGIKQPGYSAAGRLVEVLCFADVGHSADAEKWAEKAMKARLDFFTVICREIKEDTSIPCNSAKIERTSLRLVT